jgi:ATP-dependent DNA helicase RecG
MAGRPEILFPLFADLETLDGVGPRTARAMVALGIERPRDLLFHLPYAGIDRTRRASVRDVVPPTTVTVEVEIGAHMPPRSRGRPYRVLVRDAALEFQLVYFHARGDYAEAAANRTAPTDLRQSGAVRRRGADGPSRPCVAQ